MIFLNQCKGTYLLIFQLDRDRRIRVGKLGEYNFYSGYYGYVGSAFGPGGLKARLQHHLRSTPRPHWHIDYLLKVGTLNQAWYSDEPERLEHSWALIIESMPGVILPINGFGSTDCRCKTHLFRFENRPSFKLFEKYTNLNDPLNKTRQIKKTVFPAKDRHCFTY
jgi:Uri superfamily endonuclease